MAEFNLDMTGMFAIHDALRRDLARVTQLDARTEGWSLFRQMLHMHHTIEDDLLWPLVREASTGQPDDLALLDQMTEEHARIEPVLEALDRALAQAGPASQAQSELETDLTEHLEHEEQQALPLIDRTLTPERWMAFGQASAQRVAPDMSRYMPWLLDGVEDDAAARLLAVLPPPVRQAYVDEWRPAFLSHDRWATKISVG